MYIHSHFGNHIFSWTTLGIQNKFHCSLLSRKIINCRKKTVLLSDWCFVLRVLPIIELSLYVFGVCAPGEENVPAAVRPTVHLAGGGVAVQIETKGGATAHTGHAAETRGNGHHTHTQTLTAHCLSCSLTFYLVLDLVTTDATHYLNTEWNKF